jgi:membrane-associated phospholipid phosphatase
MGVFYVSNCNGQDNTIQRSGDVLLFTLPLSAITSTLILEDYKGTWQFSKGLIATTALTYGLKYIVGKERPNGKDNLSFPSGHTSTTFQSAAFLQKRYGWKIGIPAYILAGYTGYSRIQSKNHDIVDVLAGAAIGIGSSYIFTTKYTKNVQVTLLNDNLGTSFVVNFNF